jgi:hypothetical protein
LRATLKAIRYGLMKRRHAPVPEITKAADRECGVEREAGLRMGLLCSPKLTQRGGEKEMRHRKVWVGHDRLAKPLRCILLIAKVQLRCSNCVHPPRGVWIPRREAKRLKVTFHGLLGEFIPEGFAGAES